MLALGERFGGYLRSAVANGYLEKHRRVFVATREQSEPGICPNENAGATRRHGVAVAERVAVYRTPTSASDAIAAARPRTPVQPPTRPRGLLSVQGEHRDLGGAVEHRLDVTLKLAYAARSQSP